MDLLLSTKWLSEMEVNDEWKQHMSSVENERLDFKAVVPCSNDITTYADYNYVSHHHHHHHHQISQKPKASPNNSPCSSTIISFGSPRVENNKSLEELYEYGETKKGVSRTPEQAQDHVLAERKRREKMTQKFVALSTLIPGLKKLDKATVLGDAISYIKELEERVKKLEVELKGNDDHDHDHDHHDNEQVVVVMTTGAQKRPRSSYEYYYDSNDACSSDETVTDGSCISSSGGYNNNNQLLLSPEIEVRASDGNMMIRVYCNNQTGVIQQVMSEIENHNLSIITSSAMPFGHNTMHITIIAQMDGESELTPKDLADNLRTAIQINLV